MAARKLPSCDGKPAELQSFCRALRADLADQIAAAQRCGGIAGALLTTVDRETKAHKTHHAAALRRQSKAGDRFVADLKAAERRGRVFGSACGRGRTTWSATAAEQRGRARSP